MKTHEKSEERKYEDEPEHDRGGNAETNAREISCMETSAPKPRHTNYGRDLSILLRLASSFPPAYHIPMHVLMCKDPPTASECHCRYDNNNDGEEKRRRENEPEHCY